MKTRSTQKGVLPVPAMPVLALVTYSLLLLWGCSYEPQTFSPPVLSPGRSGHAAVTLLDGRILVIGGRVPAPLDPDGSEATATALIISPVSGRVQQVGSMAMKRTRFTATLLRDGRVLVAGGQSHDPFLVATDQAEVFDPATNRFEPAGGPMITARHTHTATLLMDGRVLLAGGDGQYIDSVNKACELFDPATGTFAPAGEMLHCRTGHTASLLDSGLVLIAGGASWVGSKTFYPADIELFDPATASFGLGNDPYPIPFGYGHTALKLRSGKVLFLDMRTNAAALYDPGNGLFESCAGLIHPRTWASFTLLDTGEIMIIGGYTWPHPSSLVPEIEKYDPLIGSSSECGRLLQVRSSHSAALLPDGGILVVGGSGPGNVMVEQCELVETGPAIRR
jgi:hypothetical protein